MQFGEWNFLFGKEPDPATPPKGAPVCVSLWMKPGGYSKTSTRDLIAWRIFSSYQVALVVGAIIFPAWMQLQYIGVIEPVRTRPPKPVKYMPWLTTRELRNALSKLIGPFPRTYRKSIQQMLQEEVYRAWQLAGAPDLRATQTKSPTRILGPGQPWDWTDDEHHAGPLMARLGARALHQFPAIAANWDMLTDDQQLKAALAYLAGVRLSIETGAASHARMAADLLDHITARPRYEPTGATRNALRRFGDDLDLAHRHPYPDDPHVLNVGTWHDETYLSNLALAQNMLDHLPEGPTGHLISELLHSATEELLTALNDGQSPVRYTWPPDLHACLAIVHWGLYPAGDTPPDRLAHFLELVEQRVTPGDQALLSPDELRQLYRAAGIRENPRPQIH